MATKTKAKSKKAAPPNVLNVAFVWDMSGSMMSIADSTREGTLGYLSDLVADEQKLLAKHEGGPFTRLSVTAFDTVFEPWVVNTPISDVDLPKLIGRYQPRGMTALYDAIAKTVTDLDSALREREAEHEKCLVVIMTDGLENSSREYGGAQGRARLLELVTSYEARGNWTFVYLGANVDAYAEASAIGIAAGNTASYAVTADSVGTASVGLSNITRTLHTSDLSNTSSAFADAGESQDYREENS